jgi:endonuclease YncB( thermonuclease family)/KaiC/GvpD/RAD55 family RecA-like ATPase
MSVQVAYQYDLFISYAGADRAWVEGYLADALRQAGLRWYADAPVAAGAVPDPAAGVLRESRRAVLVVSPAYLAERLPEVVALLAEVYGTGAAPWPVSLLILQSVTLPPLPPMLPLLDARDAREWPYIVNRLCAELGHRIRPAGRIPPCPYPGLRPFAAGDARFFYGRDAEIGALLGRLRRERLLLVVGPPGSGKTSLIQAGLLPQLPASPHWPPGFWLVRTMRPGGHPLVALAATLQAGHTQPRDVITALLGTQDGAGRLLLIVDPLEEVFALAAPAEQERFLAALRALRADARCALILVMRNDFYADLANSPLWPIRAGQRMEVSPPQGEALRAAIQEPALDRGVHIEPALLERLLADAADEPRALPLLQETLGLLWTRMERRLIPLAAYQRADMGGRGGLAGALAARADAVFAALPAEQQAVARRILLRLVQPGAGRPDTGRPQALADLRSAHDDPALLEPTLRALAAQRMIRVDDTAGAGDPPVELAHEILICAWPRLGRWVREWREAEQTRRRLDEHARTWMRQGAPAAGRRSDARRDGAERRAPGRSGGTPGHDTALPVLVERSRAALAPRPPARGGTRPLPALPRDDTRITRPLLLEPARPDRAAPETPGPTGQAGNKAVRNAAAREAPARNGAAPRKPARNGHTAPAPEHNGHAALEPPRPGTLTITAAAHPVAALEFDWQAPPAPPDGPAPAVEAVAPPDGEDVPAPPPSAAESPDVSPQTPSPEERHIPLPALEVVAAEDRAQAKADAVAAARERMAWLAKQRADYERREIAEAARAVRRARFMRGLVRVTVAVLVLVAVVAGGLALLQPPAPAGTPPPATPQGQSAPATLPATNPTQIRPAPTAAPTLRPTVTVAPTRTTGAALALPAAPSLTAATVRTATASKEALPARTVAAIVSRVVSGDTLDVMIGPEPARVRLIGIEAGGDAAPPGGGCFGPEATARVQQLVVQAGRQVLLEKDVSEADASGRLLRYVWLPGAGAPVLLNEELAGQGYAQVRPTPPDGKYQDRLRAAQQTAQAQRRGRWAVCAPATPQR